MEAQLTSPALRRHHRPPTATPSTATIPTPLHSPPPPRQHTHITTTPSHTFPQPTPHPHPHHQHTLLTCPAVIGTRNWINSLDLPVKEHWRPWRSITGQVARTPRDDPSCCPRRCRLLIAAAGAAALLLIPSTATASFALETCFQRPVECLRSALCGMPDQPPPASRAACPQVGGWTVEHEGLTFASVRGAGHMVSAR